MPTVHCGQHINRPKWLRQVIKGEIKSTSIFYQDFCVTILKYVQNHYLLSVQKTYVLSVLKIVWEIFLCGRCLWKLNGETTFASGIVMFMSNMSIEINILKWLSEKKHWILDLFGPEFSKKCFWWQCKDQPCLPQYPQRILVGFFSSVILD